MEIYTKENIKSQFYIETKSPAYRHALNNCERVAMSKSNVLLIGESGTGKEVAAQYIHACSQRNTHPFIAVNCSSFTESLLESELFGHEQGAFTGAVRSRTGKFELAQNGTLFIDEVGDINLTTQVKLLRAIESKEIEKIGSNDRKQINFRLLTATNKDLSEEVRRNSFREDFFYRISTIVIKIPSLRERKEDLEDMIWFFLKEAQEENNIHIHDIDSAVWTFLMNYEYPGNIRELKNTIDRMVVLSEDGVITKEGIPLLYNLHKTTSGKSYDSVFDELITWKEFKANTEKNYLKRVLSETNGNVSEAAVILGISTRQIFNKISEYHIPR